MEEDRVFPCHLVQGPEDCAEPPAIIEPLQDHHASKGPRAGGWLDKSTLLHSLQSLICCRLPCEGKISEPCPYEQCVSCVNVVFNEIGLTKIILPQQKSP